MHYLSNLCFWVAPLALVTTGGGFGLIGCLVFLAFGGLFRLIENGDIRLPIKPDPARYWREKFLYHISRGANPNTAKAYADTQTEGSGHYLPSEWERERIIEEAGYATREMKHRAHIREERKKLKQKAKDYYSYKIVRIMRGLIWHKYSKDYFWLHKNLATALYNNYPYEIVDDMDIEIYMKTIGEDSMRYWPHAINEKLTDEEMQECEDKVRIYIEKNLKKANEEYKRRVRMAWSQIPPFLSELESYPPCKFDWSLVDECMRLARTNEFKIMQ